MRFDKVVNGIASNATTKKKPYTSAANAQRKVMVNRVLITREIMLTICLARLVRIDIVCIAPLVNGIKKEKLKTIKKEKQKMKQIASIKKKTDAQTEKITKEIF